jgi:hypothetical protein
MTVSFYYSVLPFVHLWQKRGVIYIFGPGMYFQTGQVIFVPEWPKGEFVSILASFCVWTKSLKCKNAVNRDSTIQSLQVRRIQVPCQPFGRSSHPVRTKCSFRPDPILYREVSVPACIRSDVSASRLDASQYSINFWFLSKFQEREDQSTVRTMWYPVRTRVCPPSGRCPGIFCLTLIWAPSL